MADLIDRQAAIQPEKRTEERTETHACDLIDRKDAIRWVKTECNPYGKPMLDFESGKKVIEHLKQMPSAQPERKTGKWLELDFTEAWEYKCDQCGRLSDFKDNYCPSCGARMEVDD